MYKVFLAGGIASGKSTVGRELERLGAWRIDLDQVSRSVLAPYSSCLDEVAAAFGSDLVDSQTGALDRGLLAKRAFCDEESTRKLEAIELPYIRDALITALDEGCCESAPEVCLVEVPLLDRMQSMMDLADEVLLVTCPMELRRKRALERGMDLDDFERRVAKQPTDEWLRAHADTVIVNDGSRDELASQVRAWWQSRASEGWPSGKFDKSSAKSTESR
ncbi:MAG: dephospho-CoA kinase [Tractidigestivibacter sp.]|jgi:dephospho-CoA kinase|uniref:dephospho-CoA kinase n=1 Tax=Tractidigestivibacter sp. TaxID=2847320 RepID=UPI003D916DA3